MIWKMNFSFRFQKQIVPDSRSHVLSGQGCITPLDHLLAREADAVKEDPVFYAHAPVLGGGRDKSQDVLDGVNDQCHFSMVSCKDS
jgi:hypothetical protein